MLKSCEKKNPKSSEWMVMQKIMENEMKNVYFDAKDFWNPCIEGSF